MANSNRIIKFRAWDKHTKKMFWGNSVCCESEYQENDEIMYGLITDELHDQM